MKKEELEKRYNELNKKITPIKKKLDRINEEERVEETKSEYEGNYFLFENSYGSDDKWKVFYKVLEVIDWYTVKVISCQKDCYGAIEIEVKTVGTTVLNKRISKKRFYNNYKKILNELKRFT